MKDPRNIDVVFRSTPNQSSWEHGQKAITRIAAHTPQGPWEGTIATIMNPNNDVSYHELLHPSGKRAIQFVRWTKKAWHVGPRNNQMEGISACCFADQLTLEVEGLLARTIAWRLIQRGLPCVYEPSRDSDKKGFCRHGDLQDDRSDPMTRARFVRVIVPKVRFWYRHYQEQNATQTKEDALRAREGFFAWAAWVLGEGPWKGYGRRNMSVRPNVPKRVPARWWARLAELLAGRD